MDNDEGQGSRRRNGLNDREKWNFAWFSMELCLFVCIGKNHSLYPELGGSQIRTEAMTRGGRVGRGRITDSGLVPRRTRLYRFFVRLSPRAAEYDGACLVELFSCLGIVPRSGDRGCSRWAELSSHRSFVCERRRLQSTKSYSLSAMLWWYLQSPISISNLHWTDIDIITLTMYKISWRIVKYVLKIKWRLPKRPKERQQKILCVLIFSAECLTSAQSEIL